MPQRLTKGHPKEVSDDLENYQKSLREKQTIDETCINLKENLINYNINGDLKCRLPFFIQIIIYEIENIVFYFFYLSDIIIRTRTGSSSPN